MPNVIKYSTGATPTGCLRKGNMLIGNNTADYGLTFFNGINPPSGGYTIYLNKASGGPSIYCPANDTQLIFITNQIAGASYTTAAQCLSYFAGQTDKLCVNRDYEGIVTDGLVLNLDAGFTPSYPKNGTTWYDLSGYARNGTLTNGPTFDSNGAIEFDGVDDYTQLNQTITLTGEFTLNLFILPTSTSGKVLLGNNGVDYLQINNAAALGLFSSAQSITLNGYSWDLSNPSMVTVTRNSSNIIQTYKNSVSSLTGSLTGDFRIRQIGQRGDLSRFYQGSIYIIQVYNRALSATEIKQNYYGGPIVTDGLVLAVDAGNLVSYESGSTITYSLTGSLSGSLVNGVGYSSTNGGSWVFDGTDDYITQPYDMSSMSEFSIEFWAKTYNTGSISADNNAALAGPNFGGTYIRVGFRHNFQDMGILMYVNGNESNVFTSILIPYSEFDELGYNHYVCTIQDNDSMNIYFNGELKKTVSIGPTLTTGLASWYQRLGNYAGAFRWTGEISTCKLYNRKLTSDEILQNYNAQKGRFGL